MYNAEFIKNKSEAITKIKDTRKTIDEALTIIYQVQGKVWVPKQ